MEYIIFCDESEQVGKFYSNFYGGALVKSSDIDSITKKLKNIAISLNLKNEVKWQKVTINYLDKYCKLVESFFELVRNNKIKIRIMFTQNAYQATNLNKEQKDNEYHILYYQFLKNAFGLKYSDDNVNPIY